jgi:hypothetical protein
MKNLQKSPIEFCCDSCQYKCFKNSEWLKHISTQKHIRLKNANLDEPKNLLYICVCGKEYKHVTSLCKHKKNCIIVNNSSCSVQNPINDSNALTNLVLGVIKNNNELQKQCMELQKQNQEFQNKILESFQEVCKNGTHNTTYHTNSHNKSFNLQFFLNETCKDAMNIMDFVESIQLQLSDLEKVGEIGFVEGISNIIVKNLKALDVTQRPVHCTDKKREVLYVKDEDKWEKQDEDNMKLRKVIKKVTDKNMRLIPKYREKYPDCNKSISRYSDQYNKIIVESMGGSGDNDHEKASKIIKNISKQVLVEKEPEVAAL